VPHHLRRLRLLLQAHLLHLSLPQRFHPYRFLLPGLQIRIEGGTALAQDICALAVRLLRLQRLRRIGRITDCP